MKSGAFQRNGGLFGIMGCFDSENERFFGENKSEMTTKYNFDGNDGTDKNGDASDI